MTTGKTIALTRWTLVGKVISLFFNMLSRFIITFMQLGVSFFLLALKRASRVALVVKNLSASSGDPRDMGLIPGSGRSPRVGNGNLLQYSCLGNPMDGGAWRTTVPEVAKSQT